jgi:hypothetical protein
MFFRNWRRAMGATHVSQLGINRKKTGAFFFAAISE